MSKLIQWSPWEPCFVGMWLISGCWLLAQVTADLVGRLGQCCRVATLLELETLTIRSDH